MKRLFSCLLLCSVLLVNAQGPARPKLVVGIVVDQMRWDYLYQFSDRYGADGFRRLLAEGFSCEQTFIAHVPTHTAPGHASIYTGSVPALNGIMGNSWYDKQLKRVMYCTEDATVQTVGSNSAAGKMSPKNLWSSTISDELRLATNLRNKSIAIALKDRGAILPGGHTANAAYWFDNASAGWISSTFYMNELPSWVKTFNDRKLPDTYMKGDWNTLYPIATYRQSTADSNAYESKLGGEDITFPHKTSAIAQNNKYEAFRTTPFGNTYTTDMALAAIEGEKLGSSGFTDFLSLSYSSTDYIGHSFGPNSIEIEDAYLRMDRELARLLKELDTKVGKGQYLVFLTSDHGTAHNPGFMRDRKLPGGTFEENALRRQLTDSLQKVFNTSNLVSRIMNYQVYLDDSVIAQKGLNKTAIKQYIVQYYNRQAGVAAAVDLADITATTLPEKLKVVLTNGYNPRLSGDVQVIFQPQWFETWRTGSTHGLWNPYDSRIPLLWFGWNIKPGKTNREVYMADIAPTLGALLKVQTPNASIGNVITEVVK